MESTEPIDPIDKTELREPMDRTESRDQSDHRERSSRPFNEPLSILKILGPECPITPARLQVSRLPAEEHFLLLTQWSTL
jgi:hypothetical protein